MSHKQTYDFQGRLIEVKGVKTDTLPKAKRIYAEAPIEIKRKNVFEPRSLSKAVERPLFAK